MKIAASRSFIVLLLLTQSPNGQAATELVMHEGSSIVANVNGSTIKIAAGNGFNRSYEFDDCRLKSSMNARVGRWYGSLGIYDPAAQFLPSFFGKKECKGISRTVVEEGQIHFDNMQFANEWIRRQQKTVGKTGKVTWTSDGLLVAWNVVPNRAQLNVSVWLMCFGGQHPQKLLGGTDSTVRVQANHAGKALYDCVMVGNDVVDQTRRQLEEEWSKYPTSD